MKHHRFASAVVFLSCLSIAACSSLPRPSGSSTSGPVKKAGDRASQILTREEAMYRSRQIRKITYQLWLSLDEDSPEFSGRLAATFEVRDDAQKYLDSLRMDFSEGRIQSLRINDVTWSPETIRNRYDGHSLKFPISDLLKGQNRVEITFSRAYSKTGDGLYRFKDPVDEKPYVFTNLEPFHAHEVFPCFDQPDLKASYEVTVEAPADWEVVANMAERDVSKVSGRLSWQFPPSPLFSTYLFALHAGPFKVWKADAEGTALRLFARESEAKNVDPQGWFSVTQKGLAFFADFFGSPYPYGKYDQILVPNLNAAAMENIAAVTFNEKFIFKSKPTQAQLLDRADVILHEMAHMWFGNLVTMRWWNGLWLNESFATYMAHVATRELKLFPGLAEETFARGEKEWAYATDSLVTNHPIEVSVPDTDHAFTLFDGITYGKGAAALQQLHQFVGDDDFREGLHRYFTRFANRNTVLSDLIQALGAAAGRDLVPWQRAWLQTKGTNEASVVLNCSEGTVESLGIRQLAEGEGNVLRPHQIEVAFYDLRGGILTREKESFPVTLNGKETPLALAKDKPCPALVFVNDRDLGFIRQKFSSEDLELFKRHLSQITPTLNRQMIWSNLMNGVRRGTVSAADFNAIALNHLSLEKSPETVTSVGQFLFNPRSNAFSILRVTPPEQRVPFLKSWHTTLARRLNAAAPGSDLQVSWFDLYLLSIHDSASAATAIEIATGKRRIPGLSLGVDRAFQALRAAARNGTIPEEAYQKLSQSFAGEEELNQRIRTQAVEASAESRFGLFSLLTREKREPAEWSDPSRLRKIMPGVLHLLNESRIRQWTPLYLAQLTSVNDREDATYAEDFTQSLYPGLCDAGQAARLQSALGSAQKLPIPARKAILEARQLDEECIRARAQLRGVVSTPSVASPSPTPSTP